jgi:MFS family permease
MVPLRRNRDFLVLWSAQLVSTLGSQVSMLAFPLLVLARTASPAKAGLVGFANTIPALLFYLPAGVLVDRHDRRRVMVAASAIGAVALGSIPAALEGVRWLWGMTFVRSSALAVAGANFIWGGIEIVLVVRAHEHGASSAAIGIMFAMLGLGGLIGALVAPLIGRRLPMPAIIVGAFWVEAAVVACLATTHDPYVLGSVAALAAFPAPAWNAVVVGARLTLTPDRLRGRVNSAARLLSASLMPLGALAGGLLVTATGTTTTLLLFSAWQVVFAAAALSARSLRNAQPIVAPAHAS